MIDWKYGFYRVLWWLGFIISISVVFYLVESNWVLSTIIMLVVALAFMGCLSIFEKRYPYFQEKNHHTTIKHFRLFHSTLILVLFILATLFFNEPIYNTFIPVYFVALSDIVPSFFTELV